LEVVLLEQNDLSSAGLDLHSFTRIGAEVQILDDLARLILCTKLIKGRYWGAVISKISRQWWA